MEAESHSKELSTLPEREVSDSEKNKPNKLVVTQENTKSISKKVELKNKNLIAKPVIKTKILVTIIYEVIIFIKDKTPDKIFIANLNNFHIAKIKRYQNKI